MCCMGIIIMKIVDLPESRHNSIRDTATMCEKLNGDVFDMNQNYHLSEKHILLVTLSV